MKIEFIQLSHGEGLDLPSHATNQSSGLDLRAAIDTDIVLNPGERILVPTGLKMALPEEHEAQIRPRSGLAYKHGISVLNTPGTVDADYRGELKVLLVNFGQEPFKIERGMRIAQMVVAKYQPVQSVLVQELNSTKRSSFGYGSTGVM